MPTPEQNGPGGQAPSPGWRATVLDHVAAVGEPPYDLRPRTDGPLARRGELRIHGAEGEVRCTDDTGRTRWAHRCEARPNAAYVSRGRVLVTTDSLRYTAWGFLGPALLLDLADGHLVAELRGDRGAVLRGGRFFLGLEGYGCFDTWEYDRDGTEVDAWRSFGHFVTGSGIRVVEQDRRNPTRSRVVRLLPGGVVEAGPALTDPTVPRPVVLEDGTVLVIDDGLVRAVGRGLEHTVLAELTSVPPDGRHRYISALRREGDRLTAIVAERDPADHQRHTVHTWTLALHAPA
ncbi:hypothetical protein [Kitasatospora sp. DSM 101779]|uniref:hypothetical protein n=1 Tax=Kitasatospora sp. DSM 101779 TaxID=2853165 RepID=UPI0021D9A989|nr:hypothetical protein [Kitasatospora sp. DSM 101779]MCU7826554.1 hypothetical protein [Kitasatospora sp. DSM 101779]